MFVISRFILSIALGGVIVFAGSAAMAQSSNATLQGTVKDATGAVVPGATVHIQSTSTGVTRDTSTNNDGFYSATNLNAGNYKVTISANGFATRVQNDVILSVGGVRDLNVDLTLSTSEVTVNVQASTNQVNAADTSIQGVVDGKQTRDLPLNGRDWTTLATLNSGVSQILTQFAGAATATTRPEMSALIIVRAAWT